MTSRNQYTAQEHSQHQGRKPKKNFMNSISKFVKKIFGFLRYVIHFIAELIENAMHLIVFIFNYLVKLLSNPTTPCVVAIIAFVGVCLIASAQWYSIGVWLGSKLGFSGVYGIGAGAAGVLLGLGINVYQLAPQLWKVNPNVAGAYQKLNIKTDFEGDEEENVNSRVTNWLSYDHGTLKKTRLITYSIETALVLLYCYSTGLTFYGIVQAAVSLLLPEKCLELASSTHSVLGKVSNHIYNQEEDHVNL